MSNERKEAREKAKVAKKEIGFHSSIEKEETLLGQ
jgi:hypothetical protein